MSLKHPAPSPAEEPTSKRHHTDNPVSPAEPLDPELSYVHRKSLPGRASLSNAADSFHFSKRHALVFNFVDVYDIVEDDLGRLKSCMLRCGICRRGNGWNWIPGGKSKGSTSNMIGHMKEKHQHLWDNALCAKMKVWGKILEEKPGETSSPLTPAPHADEPVCNFRAFIIDKLANYMRSY
jgi:hypothetical protein